MGLVIVWLLLLCVLICCVFVGDGGFGIFGDGIGMEIDCC